MGAKIVKDPHYTRNNRDEEVFTLIISRDGVSSFGRSYTIPELKEISDTILKFLEAHYAADRDNIAADDDIRA